MPSRQRDLSKWMSEDWGRQWRREDIVPSPSPPTMTCHLPEKLCGLRPQYPRVAACPALASKPQPRPHSISYNQTSKVSSCSLRPGSRWESSCSYEKLTRGPGGDQSWGGCQGPHFCPRITGGKSSEPPFGPSVLPPRTACPFPFPSTPGRLGRL